MRVQKRLPQIAGAAAAGLLLLLLAFSGLVLDREEQGLDSADREETVTLTFEPEVLSYDGRGRLNLLEGVTAVSSDGEDLTGQVQAVLTPKGSGGLRKVRYSVFSPDGTETTKTRNLQLEGYTGPEIEVEDPLALSAEDLTDLAAVLKNDGRLAADDGFSQDASDQVSWVRSRISRGSYTITFTLRNRFSDEAVCTVRASISGEVSDIELELLENSVTVSVGEAFDPLRYVASAYDPEQGELLSGVQVESMVDVSRPGSYLVTYTLRSADQTQEARQVLQVRVQ